VRETISKLDVFQQRFRELILHFQQRRQHVDIFSARRVVQKHAIATRDVAVELSLLRAQGRVPLALGGANVGGTLVTSRAERRERRRGDNGYEEEEEEELMRKAFSW